MKLLSVSTDKNIFNEESAVRARMVEYGTLFDEIHVIVLGRAGLEKKRISQNVWVYSTRSTSKWFYIKDAVRIGSGIIKAVGFNRTRDVITTQDPFETGLVGLKLKKLFCLPLHIQIHTDFLSPYFKKHSVLNRLRVTMSKKVIARADALRVVSERIKKSIERKGIAQCPIEVLPIFTDTSRFESVSRDATLKNKYPQFDHHILMASRLTSEKDISSALRAVDRLVKKFPKAGLIIVGEGPRKEALVAQAIHLAKGKNIIFEPWRTDLFDYYKSADIYLSTSLYEGYGLSMVEAVAARTALVATDAGIAPELLGRENVCPVGDEACLQEKLEKLIVDERARKSLAEVSYIKMQKILLRDKSEHLRKFKENIISALEHSHE